MRMATSTFDIFFLAKTSKPHRDCLIKIFKEEWYFRLNEKRPNEFTIENIEKLVKNWIKESDKYYTKEKRCKNLVTWFNDHL